MFGRQALPKETLLHRTNSFQVERVPWPLVQAEVKHSNRWTAFCIFLHQAFMTVAVLSSSFQCLTAFHGLALWATDTNRKSRIGTAWMLVDWKILVSGYISWDFWDPGLSGSFILSLTYSEERSSWHHQITLKQRSWLIWWKSTRAFSGGTQRASKPLWQAARVCVARVHLDLSFVLRLHRAISCQISGRTLHARGLWWSEKIASATNLEQRWSVLVTPGEASQGVFANTCTYINKVDQMFKWALHARAEGSH